MSDEEAKQEEPVNVERELAIVGRYLDIYDRVCRFLHMAKKAEIQGGGFAANQICIHIDLGLTKETLETFGLQTENKVTNANETAFTLDVTDDRPMMIRAIEMAYNILRIELDSKILQRLKKVSPELAEQQRERFRARRKEEDADLAAFTEAQADVRPQDETQVS